MSAGAAAANALVSVVIPSYNHERYIVPAIESVLAQSHTELELIIIDDGSSDGSVSLIRQIGDNRINLVEQENRGAHSAINRGLEMANGDYLAILNSDDLFHPDRLARCVGHLEDTGSDLVASWLEVIDQSGATMGIKRGWENMLPWGIPDYEQSFAADNDFALNILATNFVATTSNVVFTRRLYSAIGGMRNLRFTHDWDFLLRAAAQFSCSLLAEPLVKYRIHDSNTISSNRRWMLFEICWVLACGMRLFEGKTLYAGEDAVSWVADTQRIHKSIQLQGNDKVLWMIRQFVDARASRGVAGAELSLLDDPAVRQPFIDAIVDSTVSAAGPKEPEPGLWASLLRRLRRHPG